MTKVLDANKYGAAFLGCRHPPGEVKTYDCDRTSKNAILVKVLADGQSGTTAMMIEQEVTTLTALKSCPHTMNVTESFSFKLSSLPIPPTLKAMSRVEILWQLQKINSLLTYYTQLFALVAPL